MVEMTVSGIILEPKTRSPIVVLKDTSERQALLIWVGEPEANAILLALEKVATPRPMTHDLLINALSALQAEVREVRVHDIKDNTFYAELEVAIGGEIKVIDARPSDAIALALRAKARILVAEHIMTSSAIPFQESEADAETEAFKKFLENVKPSDFGQFGGG